MGFFGKNLKRSENFATEKSDEYVLKEELEEEVERLQNEFRTKQADLEEVSGRLGKVREEYDTAVANLMAVKKETNQKKTELDIIQREYRETKSKMLNAGREFVKNKKSVSDLDQAGTDLAKIKQELEVKATEYDEIKNKVDKEQKSLHKIKSQQIQAQKEMEEANARLYNARQDLSNLQPETADKNSGVLSSAEKKLFVQTGKSESAGIIEAASAVVGSLKSKLNVVENELETVQQLLEKERKEHYKTKEDLKKLREKNQSHV